MAEKRRWGIARFFPVVYQGAVECPNNQPSVATNPLYQFREASIRSTQSHWAVGICDGTNNVKKANTTIITIPCRNNSVAVGVTIYQWLMISLGHFVEYRSNESIRKFAH